MDLEVLGGWLGVLAFVIVVGCIASIFGFQVRRPGASRAEAIFARSHHAEGSPERDRQPSERRLAIPSAGFPEAAREALEPLLRALVDRAHAHGFEARYAVTGEGQAMTYRLEVKRPDHPADQPLPYISVSASDDGLVEVVYGGMFPGPADHNRQDTEIGWRTIRWAQVDNVLATFAHKVFARFD